MSSIQGQARVYGHTTHFLPLPCRHTFQRARVTHYALATPRPRQSDKIMPDGARQKIAGSIWFPGPKI